MGTLGGNASQTRPFEKDGSFLLGFIMELRKTCPYESKLLTSNQFFLLAWFTKLEFIALKEKGSTNEVSIYFFWRDTDKIKSVKHGRHEVSGFWR